MALAVLGVLSLEMAGAGQGGEQPAIYGPWRSCKIGGGGYMQGVVFAPSDPGRLYSYVDVGGVFRSDDGGRCMRLAGRSWS